MILITGAAGFIGSAVAQALNRQGCSDLILCDTAPQGAGVRNLEGVSYRSFVPGDQLFDFLDDAPAVAGVVHLGACADTTEQDMAFLLKNNVEFSIRLCSWSLEHGARFVYASSAAVYGDGSQGFADADELTPRLQPLNKYGLSKWKFDMWVLENGLQSRVAGLRYFNVFGPNEYHKGRMASVVCRVFPQALRQGRVQLFESHRQEVAHGEQARDFVYIDEAVAMTLFVLAEHQANGIFNAGTGRAHTFNQLAKALFEGLGTPANIDYIPMPEDLRGRYQYYTCAEMTRLRAAGFPAGEDRFRQHVVRYVREYLKPGQRCLAAVP